MKELDELISLLESDIPANPASPKNMKLADAIEADIRKYFKTLESMMPQEEMEALYYRNVKE
jgi:hypothetical protein